LTTSYLSRPKTGSHGAEESSDAFPFTTTSWFLLDDVEVMAPAGSRLIVAFGDSITDGTNSTLNGDDRWPDFLSQRLHAALGTKISVVNAGIGGNRVLGPEPYDPARPFSGGPSALSRLDRDVLSLPGLSTVICLEGINDLGAGGNADAIIDGFRKGVARLHENHLKVIGATIVSALNSTPTQGTAEVYSNRKAINQFIRTGGVFDGVADFDAAVRDAEIPTQMAARWDCGDGLHQSDAGYCNMADVIDLALFD